MFTRFLKNALNFTPKHLKKPEPLVCPDTFGQCEAILAQRARHNVLSKIEWSEHPGLIEPEPITTVPGSHSYPAQFHANR